jgi:hypothetical protein
VLSYRGPHSIIKTKIVIRSQPAGWEMMVTTGVSITNLAFRHATTMSNFVPYQQSYGTYQQPYPIVYATGSGPPQLLQPAVAHYPHRFPPPPPPPPAAASTYQFHVQTPRQPSVAVAEIIPDISPEIASKQVQRLILVQLQTSEYDSIEPPALKRLEKEVVACMRPFILLFIELTSKSSHSEFIRMCPPVC